MYVGTENKEKSELNNPMGYFRRMRDNLNIKVMEASSLQAKGRIKRSNKTHQDRLVKALRFKNITNIEEANKHLDKEYIKEHNKKFSIIIDIVDIHRRFSKDKTLNDICYVEKTRKLRNDWTVSFKGKWYQLKKQSQYYPLTKSTVYIRMYLDGTIGIFYSNL
jgi:hypothetical protein